MTDHTTPADHLRAAATQLRTLATAAAKTTGSAHWEAQRIRPKLPNSTATRLHATGARRLIHGGAPRREPFVTSDVGDYIATMDPTTGLALADLLDEAAAFIQAYPDLGREHVDGQPCDDYACRIVTRLRNLTRDLAPRNAETTPAPSAPNTPRAALSATQADERPPARISGP